MNDYDYFSGDVCESFLIDIDLYCRGEEITRKVQLRINPMWTLSEVLQKLNLQEQQVVEQLEDSDGCPFLRMTELVSDTVSKGKTLRGLLRNSKRRRQMSVSEDCVAQSSNELSMYQDCDSKLFMSFIQEVNRAAEQFAIEFDEPQQHNSLDEAQINLCDIARKIVGLECFFQYQKSMWTEDVYAFPISEPDRKVILFVESDEQEHGFFIFDNHSNCKRFFEAVRNFDPSTKFWIFAYPTQTQYVYGYHGDEILHEKWLEQVHHVIGPSIYEGWTNDCVTFASDGNIYTIFPWTVSSLADQYQIHRAFLCYKGPQKNGVYIPWEGEFPRKNIPLQVSCLPAPRQLLPTRNARKLTKDVSILVKMTVSKMLSKDLALCNEDEKFLVFRYKNSRCQICQNACTTLTAWMSYEGFVMVACLVKQRQLGHAQLENCLTLNSDIDPKNFFSCCEEKLGLGSKCCWLSKLKNFKSIVINSMPGTGKTYEVERYLKDSFKEAKYTSVLFITCRRTQADDLYHRMSKLFKEFQKSIELYSNFEGDMSQCDFLIVQVESLHKLSGRKTPFELIIMDESESVLNQMTSTTVKKPDACAYVVNHLTLKCKKLIAMDAYVSDRTMQFISDLRGPLKDIAFVCNTWAQKRTAFIMSCSMLRQKAMSELLLQRQKILQTGSKNNSKIAFVFSAKRKAMTFLANAYEHQVNGLLIQREKLYFRFRPDELDPDEFAKMRENFVNDFHFIKKTKDGGKVDSKDELNYDFIEISTRVSLKNVNLFWSLSCVHFLAYTSTITVGVNFDPDVVYYNRIYALFGVGGPTTREMFQAIERVRKTHTGELYLAIDDNCVKENPLPLLIDARQARHIQKQIAKDTGIQLGREFNWLESVKLFSDWEQSMSKNFLCDTVEYFLKTSGYTTKLLSFDNSQVTDANLPLLNYSAVQSVGLQEYSDLLKRELSDTLDYVESMKIVKYALDHIIFIEETPLAVKRDIFSFYADSTNYRAKGAFRNILLEVSLGIHDETTSADMDVAYSVTKDLMIGNKLKLCRLFCSILGVKYSNHLNHVPKDLLELTSDINLKRLLNVSLVGVVADWQKLKSKFAKMGIKNIDLTKPFADPSVVALDKAVFGMKLLVPIMKRFFKEWSGTTLKRPLNKNIKTYVLGRGYFDDFSKFMNSKFDLNELPLLRN